MLVSSNLVELQKVLEALSVDPEQMIESLLPSVVTYMEWAPQGLASMVGVDQGPRQGAAHGRTGVRASHLGNPASAWGYPR